MEIKKKKIIRIVLIVVLILIMLLLWFGLLKGKGFSKYNSKINSTSVSQVAKPVFIVSGDSNIKIDGIEDTIYKFNVKNYDNNGKSDVDLKYTIQIVNNSQADLEFILKNNGNSVNLTNNKTDPISLSSANTQKDEYELQIKYNNNPAITSDIDGNVQIKVEAVQAE